MARFGTLVRLTTAVLIATPLTSAYAQDSTTVLPLQTLLSKGRLVRLHLYDGRTLRGHVAGTSDSTVLMSGCSACMYGTFRFADVAGVDTLVGKSHRVRHAVVGALVGGAAVAGALVYAGTQQDRGCHDGPCGLWVLSVPPAFGVGAFVGGIAGAFLPAERWAPSAFSYHGATITPST